MAKEKNLIHIGTSGWHYKHWIGPFYPENTPPKDFLNFYQQKFHTVELNNSFYRLPAKETFENWRDSVGDEFLFSVKASRYITHLKKLKDCKEPLDNFLRQAEGLGEKLGPILFQTPSNFKKNLERLEEFLSSLPDKFDFTFELRNDSWFDNKVYKLLNKYKASFCVYELADLHSPKLVTCDFAYVRLHGPDGRYAGKYTKKALEKWAAEFNGWTKNKKRVYCYFDNDQNAYAAQNARQLQEMIG